jgi:tRNA(Arg) A34 adenosine deaminase TadA
MAISVTPVANARMASAIVIKNDIIAFGVNNKKTHPMQAKYSKHCECVWMHAEITAIKNALKIIDIEQLTKATLYVARVKYTDSSKKKLIQGLAKPCSGCKMAIAAFDIRNVVYSVDGESGYESY